MIYYYYFSCWVLSIFFFFFIYESSAKRIAIFYEFKGPGNVNENIHKTTIIIISRKVGLCEFSF